MDVSSGVDRHLNITFRLQYLKSDPLFPYFLEKHFAIPTTFPFLIFTSK